MWATKSASVRVEETVGAMTCPVAISKFSRPKSSVIAKKYYFIIPFFQQCKKLIAFDKS